MQFSRMIAYHSVTYDEDMGEGLVALFCCCSLKVVVSSLGDEFKPGHFTDHILLLQQVRGPGYSRYCLHLLPSKLGKTKVS